jgi:hypothetical protein
MTISMRSGAPPANPSIRYGIFRRQEIYSVTANQVMHPRGRSSPSRDVAERERAGAGAGRASPPTSCAAPTCSSASPASHAAPTPRSTPERLPRAQQRSRTQQRSRKPRPKRRASRRSSPIRPGPVHLQADSAYCSRRLRATGSSAPCRRSCPSPPRRRGSPSSRNPSESSPW